MCRSQSVRVSFAFACLAHQRAETPGKVLEIRRCRAKPFFTLSVSLRRQLTQPSACGQGLRGCRPPEVAKVAAGEQPALGAKPGCPENPVMWKLALLFSQPAVFISLLLQAFIAILFCGLTITPQLRSMNPASFSPKP